MDDMEQLNVIRLQVASKDREKRQLSIENHNLKVRITELEMIVKKYRDVESKMNEYDFMRLHLKKQLAEAEEKGARESRHQIEWLKKELRDRDHKRESDSDRQRQIELLQREVTEILRREEQKRDILYNELMKYSGGLKKLELKYRNDVESWKAKAEEESKAKQDVTADNGLLKGDLASTRKENAEVLKAKNAEIYNLERELENTRWDAMQVTVSKDKAELAAEELKKKYHELQKKYESIEKDLDTKYTDVDNQIERNVEHKTKLYEHCFEQRREYKILYRDFMELKEDLKEKEEEIRKLKASVQNEKIGGNSRDELTRLLDENACLKQIKEELKEDIELEFQEQIFNLEQTKSETEAELGKALSDMDNMQGKLTFVEKALGLANEKIARLETAKFQAEKKIEGMNSEINSLKEYQMNAESSLLEACEKINSLEEYQMNAESSLIEAREKINSLENAKEKAENEIKEMNRENTSLADEPAVHEPDFSFEFDDNSASDEREEIAQKVASIIDNEHLLKDVEFEPPTRNNRKDEMTQTSDDTQRESRDQETQTSDDTQQDSRNRETQTEPPSEIQTVDIAVSTDQEVISSPAPVSLHPDGGHPRAEWVQENNVTKLLLTFAGNAPRVSICEEDKDVTQNGNKRKQESFDETGRKSFRLNDTEPVNMLESDAGPSNSADANLSIETPSPSKRYDIAVMSTSARNEIGVIPDTKNRPEDALRQKFLDLLDKMRIFEIKLLENIAFENQQSQLFQCMLGLLRNGDDAFMTQNVIEYLLTRKTEISLSPRKRDIFANGEKCIASCYAKFIPMGRSKIVDDFLRLLLTAIRKKEKYHVSGYASACLVYAMICESASHHTNVRTLCYKILMHHKEYSVFLVACIYRVYPDARDYSDKKTVRFWLERVIMHVLSKKPNSISDQKWQEILGVLKEDPSFLDKSGESPEHLLEEIMSDIRKYKKARYEDLREDFGHALMLLATYYGKKWTNNVLNKHIIHFKGGPPRTQAKNKNILDLFEMVERKSQSFFDEVKDYPL